MINLQKEEILLKLHELTKGLFFPSESDYPIEVVSFESTSTEITNVGLRHLIGQLTSESIKIVELSHFFRNVSKPSQETSEAINQANKFKALQTFIEQELYDIKVYRIGRREVKVYILGKYSKDGVVGIKTVVIET